MCLVSFMLRPLYACLQSPVGYCMDEWYHVLRGRSIDLSVTLLMVKFRRANDYSASIHTVEDTNLGHLS